LQAAAVRLIYALPTRRPRLDRAASSGQCETTADDDLDEASGRGAVGICRLGAARIGQDVVVARLFAAVDELVVIEF